MTSNQNAIVYLFLPGDGYVPAGTLKYFPSEDYSTFQYGKKYLQRPNALPIDPVKIPLVDILFETSRKQSLFNVFRDSAPDRWGQKVLSIMSKAKANAFEILTAMSPKYRMGALAYGADAVSGPKSLADWYKGDALGKATNNLKEITKYVRLVDNTDDEDLDVLREQILENDILGRTFVLSLSPAGGARPKALVSYDNIDWIAKFPKRDDTWNEALIEHGCLTLAKKCQINVAETRVIKEGNVDILLVKRFDKKNREPLHFASAYTIVDLIEDGDWKSYQALANAARQYGDPNVGEQIFRRMVFNVLCLNTDDHPRNHAFFIHRNKIELTPAYDIVPYKYRIKYNKQYSLALKIGEQGTLATIKNALSDVGPFGISKQKAESIVFQMQNVLAGWPEHFKSIGVCQKDREKLLNRFSYSHKLQSD